MSDAPTGISKILRVAQVMEATGLSRTTIWRLEHDGRFPQRRRLGPNSVGWVAGEVEEWVLSREQIPRSISPS